MSKLSNKIFYAGLEKDQFESISQQIYKKNTKNINVYSIVIAIFFIAATAANLIITKNFRPVHWIYINTSVVMSIIFLVSREIIKNRVTARWVHIGLNVVFIAGIYYEGIALSVSAPAVYGESVAFFVELVIAPMICMDKPIRFIIIQTISMIIFACMSYLYKTPEIARFELTNCWLFLIISILIIVFVSSIHIRELYHSIQLEYLSVHDVLTGVKNRNCYEKTLDSIESKKEDNLFFIYADVNELHELNNSEGHQAGDIMIQTVASELKNVFGENYTFRIGGDEFIAYSKVMTRAQMDKAMYDLDIKLKKAGYNVSLGFAGNDEQYKRVGDIVKLAEKRMYEQKKKYYALKGISYGSRVRDL